MPPLSATLESRLALVVASGILEHFSHPPPLWELRIGDNQVDLEAEANGTKGKAKGGWSTLRPDFGGNGGMGLTSVGVGQSPERNFRLEIGNWKFQMVRRVDGFTPWMTVLNKIDLVLVREIGSFRLGRV